MFNLYVRLWLLFQYKTASEGKFILAFAFSWHIKIQNRNPRVSQGLN